MDKREMLEVIGQDPEVNEFDLEKLFKGSYDRFLFPKASHGIPASHGVIHGVSNRHFCMDYNETPEHNANVFKVLLHDKGISEEDFKTYYHNCTLAGSCYKRETDYSLRERELVDLVFFIRMYEQNKPDEDYKESYAFIEKTLKICNSAEKYKFTLGEVTAERFKNGRLKLSAPEDFFERLERIREIYHILH